LAARLGGLVTKQALPQYEQGKARPSPLVRNRLAAVLRVKAVYLWSEPTVKVECVAYRKRSALPKREQKKVESLTIQSLEERVRLQPLTEQAEQADLPIKRWAEQKLEDAECAAEELRRNRNLGLEPIASFVSVLEDHPIQVTVAALRATGTKRTLIDFIGFNGESPFQCSFQMTEHRNRTLLPREIEGP
jgi:hypothetical protein